MDSDLLLHLFPIEFPCPEMAYLRIERTLAHIGHGLLRTIQVDTGFLVGRRVSPTTTPRRHGFEDLRRRQRLHAKAASSR